MNIEVFHSSKCKTIVFHGVGTLIGQLLVLKLSVGRVQGKSSNTGLIKKPLNNVARKVRHVKILIYSLIVFQSFVSHVQ